MSTSHRSVGVNCFRVRFDQVTDLQCASLVVLGVDPGSECELCDEDLSCLGKQDWSLCTDHLHTGDGVTLD